MIQLYTFCDAEGGSLVQAQSVLIILWGVASAAAATAKTGQFVTNRAETDQLHRRA
jgi:hypothetical protein